MQKLANLIACAAALAVMAICSTRESSAAPFQNGSFETNTGTTAAGWTVSTVHAAFSGGEGYTNGTAAAIYNSGSTNGDAVISQTFSTAVGAIYGVSFDYGNFGAGDETQTLQVEVLNGATELIHPGATINPATSGSPTLGQSGGVLTINALGTGSGATDGVAAPTSEFSAFAFTFTATGSTSTIAFSDLTAGGGFASDGILDNVKVTAITPEPSSLILCGLGAVGLFVAARRRRKPTEFV